MDLQICENEIMNLEKRLLILEQELTQPDVFSNHELTREKNLEYEKIKKLLKDKYSLWEELNYKIEEIEKQFN